MNYKKFHKMIEADNPERKEALYQRLNESLNIPGETVEPTGKSVSVGRKPFKISYRLIASLSAALVVVCLAIIIPIALNNRVSPPSERYCYSADCQKIESDYSIKEYAERNNLPYLYINWYEIAENVQTSLFVNATDPNDVVYMHEKLLNGETGSIVSLSISDLYTKVDIFDDYWVLCANETSFKGVNMHWHQHYQISRAYFEYSGYRYFVELTYPMTEDSIIEIVESMLP